MASSGSILELTGIVSAAHGGSFWQLLMEVTAVETHCQNLAMQTQYSTSHGCAFSLRVGCYWVPRKFRGQSQHTINSLTLIWTIGTEKITLMLLGLISIKLVLRHGG